LALRHALRPEAVVRLRALLDLLDGDPHTPSTVTAPEQAIDTHLGDSLSALELEPLRTARRIVDIGSGAGLPGLALAIALPQAQVALVESVARRCEFLQRACDATSTANAQVVNARAEAWPEGIADHDVATARAVGPLALLCEYAAPLLALGGTLVAWKGSVSDGEQAAGDRAAGELGLEPAGVVRSRPYPSSHTHHFHMYVKTTETPNRFPRRPGIARKRPLGAPR
jgi:16S rRNA (guanine527-N7)-methyltransferase